MNENILDFNPAEQPKLNHAGFFVRFLAYLFDVIPIVFIVIFILSYVFGLDLFDQDSSIDPFTGELTDSAINRMLSRNLTLIIWIIYSTVMDASPLRGTHGKVNARIRVVDQYGNRISWQRSMLRNGMKIISSLPLGLGFIWAAFDKEKRAWHDIIAKTFVIQE